MPGKNCEFTCGRCGDCCRKHGLYPATASDAADMALHLDLDVDEFLDRFCTVAVSDGRRGLFIAGRDGACPFLEGDTCSVHDCKPMACTIFPDNDGYVTAERLKADMKSSRVSGPGLSRCAVWQLPDDGVLAPNIEATIRFRIKEDTDRQYFASHGYIEGATAGYLARLARIRVTDMPLYLLVARKYGLLRQFYTVGLKNITPLVQAERDILFRYGATYAAANMLPEAAVEPRSVRATFVDGMPGIAILCDELPPEGGEAHFFWKRYGEAGIFAAEVEGGGAGRVTAFVIHTPCLDDIVRDGTLHLAFSDGTKKVTFACREGVL